MRGISELSKEFCVYLLIMIFIILDQILVGARFSAPIQTGRGAHTASCKMGTGSFSWVKRPGYGVDDPPHLASRLKKE
jgi:hypothetical protein